MSDLATLKERLQLGPHLSLVERKHLLYTSNIPGEAVPAFSTGYSIIRDLQRDFPELEEELAIIHEWSDELLMLAVSVRARGRDDMVKTLTRMAEEKIHSDYGSLPPSMDDLDPDESPKKKAKKAVKTFGL